MQTEKQITLEDVVKYLLSNQLTTPGDLADAVDGLEWSEHDDCIILEDSPWIADDGNCDVEYDSDEYTARGAAHEYVEGGDWGDELSGCVDVSVWKRGIDSNGNECRAYEETFSIDLCDALDHGDAIEEAMGDAGCGLDPDDHDWTSEGEGGLDNNPGVWSTGGTSFVFKSHCRVCGLHRTETKVGSQRNPGEGDSVEYRALDEEEIAWHRKNGSMDEE